MGRFGLAAKAAPEAVSGGGGGIDVVAGNDAAQMAAAFLLWDAWCRETRGHGINAANWFESYRAKTESGAFVQVIAWDGPVPVGMYEAHRQWDLMADHWEGWGDKAYIVPRYRGGGVYRAMVDASDAVGSMMGVEEIAIPVGVGQQADWLDETYARRGYILSGKIMRRRLE